MKSILWLMAAVSAVVFFFGTYSLISQYRRPVETGLADTHLHGFQNDDNTIPGLADLKKEFSEKINGYNKKADNYHSKWVLLSFLVTALTAASALVSAIKAVKTDPASSSKAMIWIAVLTFFAALSSGGATQLNDLRSDIVKKSATVSDKRAAFYLEYQKLTDDKAKTEAVSKYKDELDNL